jgi:hypothetical protein
LLYDNRFQDKTKTASPFFGNFWRTKKTRGSIKEALKFWPSFLWTQRNIDKALATYGDRSGVVLAHNKRLGNMVAGRKSERSQLNGSSQSPILVTTLNIIMQIKACTQHCIGVYGGATNIFSAFYSLQICY